jgi:hypothetical protein
MIQSVSYISACFTDHQTYLTYLIQEILFRSVKRSCLVSRVHKVACPHGKVEFLNIVLGTAVLLRDNTHTALCTLGDCHEFPKTINKTFLLGTELY